MPGTASPSGFGSLAQTGFWLCWSDGTDAINASETDCLAGHIGFRTGESVRDLPDWNYGLSCPEVDAGGAAETGDFLAHSQVRGDRTNAPAAIAMATSRQTARRRPADTPSDLVLLALV